MTEVLYEQFRRDPASEWWKSGVVYQIYPRSFADTNADGVGDLPGVTSRLDYLAGLGIDAIWLSPFYPSPLADGGYDVSDYCDVDSRLGTLDDFDQLVGGAHRRGLKVLIDIVPNHTSTAHPWFREALRSPRGSAARERYIFRDGRGEEPPSDWQSHFGGSAWEELPDGQWYCHLFDRAQPDLNWSNPEVRAYFLDVLRFWAGRGVDGFRIDVAHALAKDLSEPLRSQPNTDSALPLDGTDPLYDRDEVHEIYREWRAVFDEYDPPLIAVAETWSPSNERTALYARSDELGQVFDFSLLKSHWGADDYRATIQTVIDRHDGDLTGVDGDDPTWVLSSHDVPRHASRLALPADIEPDQWLLTDGLLPAIEQDRGVRRARAATLMMLALPGSAYLYQGEELGLREVVELSHDELQDPVWQRSGGSVKGRDGCRVPLPWSASGSSFGFGADHSWLPQPDDWGAVSVETQEADPTSTLHLYRAALRLRRTVVPRSVGLVWSRSPSGILAFGRGEFRSVTNFTDTPHALELAAGERIVLSTRPETTGCLPAEATLWITAAALT